MSSVHYLRKFLFCNTLIIIFCLLAPSSTFGQLANDAILSLKKMEARTEAGISYRDYTPVLGEIKFPVNLFLESSEASLNPNLTIHIYDAMRYYELASSVWEYKFSGDMISGEIQNFIPETYFYGERIIKEFPDIEIGKYGIFIKSALLRCWSEASKEIKLASDIYAKMDSNTEAQNTDLDKIEKEVTLLRKENEKLKADNENIRRELSILKKGK